MRKMVIMGVVLVSFVVILLLLTVSDERASHPVIPKSLHVSKLWLDGQYEQVFQHLSYITFERNSEKKRERYIQATRHYRSRGRWVRDLKSTDVRTAKVVTFSPKAKGFLVATAYPNIAVPSEIKTYIEHHSPNQFPPPALDRFVFVEVRVGAATFLQAWHLDTDGEWRILSWPLNGDPETTREIMSLMKEFGITE
mgnify:CR=1 FL=1